MLKLVGLVDNHPILVHSDQKVFFHVFVRGIAARYAIMFFLKHFALAVHFNSFIDLLASI